MKRVAAVLLTLLMTCSVLAGFTGCEKKEVKQISGEEPIVVNMDYYSRYVKK